MTMDEEGLDIDSLDRLAIANILCSQFCIAEARAFDRFLHCRKFGDRMTLCRSRHVKPTGTRTRRQIIGLIPNSQTLI